MKSVSWTCRSKGFRSRCLICGTKPSRKRRALRLNIMEKEEQIASMQRQLEDLELIYQYLTGPRFRQRIEAIVEKFSIMQTDLERERKTMTRLRAKREGQIKRCD